MSLKEELIIDIGKIVDTKWSERDGAKVPKSEDIGLINDGVNLDSAMLYSDLVHSTDLTSSYSPQFAAEIYKLFISSSTRIIKYWDGYIRSFDGDRIMGVFIGDNKSFNAVCAALQITWSMHYFIIPKIRNFYANLKLFDLKHCTGIDTSKVFVVRGGVRNDNDLVWIGRAANAAAKLSELRYGYSTIISAETYNDMGIHGQTLNDIDNNRKPTYIWNAQDWNGVDGINKIYMTSWRREIS